MRHRLAFLGARPLELTLAHGTALADELPGDCPVLLGCRTGICGTCIAAVRAATPLDPPNEDERELLDLIAPGHARARLLCCLRATSDLVITTLEDR
jgi:ferredoxin